MIYLFLVSFVIVGSALTVLTVQNLEVAVQITLFEWKTPALPSGLLLFIFFLAGALLLYIVAAIAARHDRKEIKVLRQRVEELEQQHHQAMMNMPPSFVPQQPFNSPGIRMPGMSGPLQN